MFTRVYGPVSTANIKDFWGELKELRDRWRGPWVMGGDSNVFRFTNERRPRGRITQSMRDFDDFVCEKGLRDSPLCNAKFTWTNRQENPILCKWDKFLVSCDWEELYPHYFQEVRRKLTSNHWHVVMQTSSRSFGPKPFRFENMWTSHPSFKDLVYLWWNKCIVGGLGRLSLHAKAWLC